MVELAVRLVLSLSLVLGLLLLLARVGGRKFRGRSGALVQIVHRQHITRGSTISVVTVGSKVLVLGTTEHQVSVLTELDPDEIELPELEAATEDDAPKKPLASLPKQGASASPLAGSVLSVDTWKQALAAATKRAS